MSYLCRAGHQSRSQGFGCQFRRRPLISPCVHYGTVVLWVVVASIFHLFRKRLMSRVSKTQKQLETMSVKMFGILLNVFAFSFSYARCRVFENYDWMLSRVNELHWYVSKQMIGYSKSRTHAKDSESTTLISKHSSIWKELLSGYRVYQRLFLVIWKRQYVLKLMIFFSQNGMSSAEHVNICMYNLVNGVCWMSDTNLIRVSACIVALHVHVYIRCHGRWILLIAEYA